MSCSISGDSIGDIRRRIVAFLGILPVGLLIITFFSPVTRGWPAWWCNRIPPRQGEVARTQDTGA